MYDQLKQAIRQTVEAHCSETDFRESIVNALSRPGYALHLEGPCRAGGLTLEVYRAIRRTPDEVALQGAAAVELYMQAAYMFDAVADGETRLKSGTPAGEELAMAIALMACGSAAAAEAVCGGGDLAPFLRFQANCVASCAGQSLDASFERRGSVSTDEALRMTCLKAGSLGRLAAGFGAGLATRDREAVSLFEDFGFNLMTYLQLMDDLRDACPSGAPRSDLERGKKTVPLAFFLSSPATEQTVAPDGIMRAQEWAQSGTEVRQRFEASGAGIFTALVAETFLNRAKKDLADLRLKIGTVEQLERLLIPLEVSPEEVAALP